MCNLFTTIEGAAEVSKMFQALDLTGNEPWLEDVYPDRVAQIAHHQGDGLAVAKARWGMPASRMYVETARDPGVTNIRNTPSPRWRSWLGTEHRCLVPVVRLSEPGADHNPI